jgi:hypothetical protein
MSRERFTYTISRRFRDTPRPVLATKPEPAQTTSRTSASFTAPTQAGAYNQALNERPNPRFIDDKTVARLVEKAPAHVVDGVIPPFLSVFYGTRIFDYAASLWILEPTPGIADSLLRLLADIFAPHFHPIDILASDFHGNGVFEDLCGPPPGCEGYLEGGQLTEFVRRHPRSIISIRGFGEGVSDADLAALGTAVRACVKDKNLSDTTGRASNVPLAECFVLITTSDPGFAGRESLEAAEDQLRKIWDERYTGCTHDVIRFAWRVFWEKDSSELPPRPRFTNTGPGD